MKKLISLFILGCLAPCLSFGEKGAGKPNVVLILVDDLGWQDVGSYDIDEPTPMETPNIDALAKKGVLFRQGYSPAPTCAPTRCAMMSGRHAAALQKTHVVGGNPTTPYNKTAHPIMDPWYSGRLEVEEVIIPEALNKNGYVSGHIGKWHMSLDHHSYPQPMDQGFDFTKAHLGESAKMKPHRLTGFATSAKNDPYQLDADGFPKDQPTLDAIEFMEQSKAQPFFLYYAAWLVHTPIHSRSKELLEKYCKKLGVDMPADPNGWPTEGQTNPYYCAMVEMLDHYIGMLVTYLEKTDDPRNPGQKLIDNTYILFTSDNGGMERVPGEIITDNYPLDRGKINAREGGVRVPFIISGPGIGAGQESNVMVNGLDFYPTILSWTGTKRPKGQKLDGTDLSKLLSIDPTDHTLVKNRQGEPRTTMMWHFPHGVAQQSTLRVDGWKLIHNWMPGRPKYELFELYKNYPGASKRSDIEEAKNLASKMPGKVKEMSAELFRRLEGVKASYPFLNPNYKGALKHKDRVCLPLADSLKAKNGSRVSLAFKERGAKVSSGQLMYTTSGKDKREEWYRAPAEIKGGRIHAILPKGTTHYFFNLIDENNFLVSYPEPVDMLTAGARKPKGAYSWEALEVN